MTIKTNNTIILLTLSIFLGMLDSIIFAQFKNDNQGIFEEKNTCNTEKNRNSKKSDNRIQINSPLNANKTNLPSRSNNFNLDDKQNHRFFTFKIGNTTMLFLYVPPRKFNSESPYYQLGMTNKQYQQTASLGLPNMAISNGTIPIGLYGEGFFILSDEVSEELYNTVMELPIEQSSNNTSKVKDTKADIDKPLNLVGAKTESAKANENIIDDSIPISSSPEPIDREKSKPVSGIKWHDAMTFCERVEKRIQNSLDKDNCKIRVIVRLPTEIEWECAARGQNSSFLFPWIENVSDIDLPKEEFNNINKVNEWFAEHDKRPIDYNSDKRNPPLVLYNFCSSKSEWCLDEWSSMIIASPVENDKIESIQYYPYSSDKHNYQPYYRIKYKVEDKIKNTTSKSHIDYYIEYKNALKLNAKKRYPNSNRCCRGGWDGAPISERYISCRRYEFTNMPSEHTGFRPVIIFIRNDYNLENEK